MDPRSQERPQGDPNRPGTSQEDPGKNQEREKKKRKCCFSAEEQEILVKEVTEHQHQVFVTLKLPVGRREVIWQKKIDTINSVAEVQRTVTECKKCWHDCKPRTEETISRNRKAVLQAGGGSPALQKDLDQMEEMVAAVIPEEIITGIQRQTAQTTRKQHKCRDDGSPVDMPVLDFPDDMGDELTTISQQTLQDVLRTLQIPPSVTRRGTDAAAIIEESPTTPIVRPASSNPAEDTHYTGTTIERTVVGVQRELAKEVHVGIQNMAASLEGMCMMTSAEQSAAMQALHKSEDEDVEQITYTRRTTR
ncbi:hypothetical protein NDU88_004366 [Pleurodeles waltl]|uniref:Myb/SANT-like DNA-binding domain-containing protein n=1 Tax=Pleurodeles waltl TaxID=8319 RepID=A0AAV7RJ38_PLEWA|nr:hypothetical protein NDU88_004366 [Pleurodeles waltl]